VICPTCGTWNKDEAFFCKYCGFDLSKAPKPVAPPQPAAPPPPAPFAPPAAVVPRPPRVRVWWHGVGVFVIVAAALVVMDLVANARITWSFVGALAAAFVVGGVLILEYLGSPDRRDRRPFIAGASLLIAAVLLLPVAVALQSSPTYTETFTVPRSAGLSALALTVKNDVGHVVVQFSPTPPPYELRAQVTHLGGLFSSHYPGDATVTNTTSGNTLTVGIDAKGIQGLFFLGGHDIVVTVDAGLVTSMDLTSNTGDIDVTLANHGYVSAGGIRATTDTGNVHVTATNDSFASGASIQAHSTTGAVSISIVQASATLPFPVDVTGTSTTGTITFTFSRGNGVAANITATVTTGTVNADTSKYTGASSTLYYAPNRATYDAAMMQFRVSLTTTTGSIDLR